MALSISIIRGDAAHKTRNLVNFISQWITLAEETIHVTAFQRPAFVNRWYEQYSSEYEPILVLGHDKQKNLVGLVPLALNFATNKLSHAADQQVEYSGWLAKSAHENNFICQAIATIYQEINFTEWHWSHCPPRANINWLLSSSHHLCHIHLGYEHVMSPVLDLHNQEKIKKIKKNKSIKSKINRLKRKGDLVMEHITDTKRAKEVMQYIPDLVNFRHGAAHGDLAFREDPQQHSFYLSRCEDLNNNHFSALWLGESLLAFHFGCIDNDTLYIGLTAFDPRESKHSPGVIFILFLAELMQQQGIRYIDLTPGGDEYKERFCNEHQALYRPVIYSTAIEKLKDIFIKQAKFAIFSTLSLFGVDRSAAVKKFKSNNSLQGGKKDFRLFNIDISSSRVDTFSSYAAKQSSMTLHIQKYNDLLIHQRYSSSLEMQELLSDATQRFSKEETLVTIMQDNKLMGYGWLSKPGAKYKNHGLELSLDKDSVVLDCIEIEKQLPNEDALEKMMKFMLAYARELGATKAFSYIPNNTENSKLNIIENLGFSAVS